VSSSQYFHKSFDIFALSAATPLDLSESMRASTAANTTTPIPAQLSNQTATGKSTASASTKSESAPAFCLLAITTIA
jgi:hypothetical protein